MNTSISSEQSAVKWYGPASDALALLAAGIVYVVWAGQNVPILSSERWATVTLWLVGLGMSIAAGRRDTVATSSGHPDYTILGWTLRPLMVLGIVAMALLPLEFSGIRLPRIAGHSGIFVLLAGIIGVKWVLAHLHFLSGKVVGGGAMDSTSRLKRNWKQFAAVLLCGMGIVPALSAPAYVRDINRARKLQMNLGSQVINTACGPIEYATAGAGQPVLVVHGVVGGYDQGIGYGRAHLGESFQLIAPSRFGYQRTPMPADASPSAQADAFACLLDALQIPRVSVLGISAGAPSSIQFALRHPDRVQALVLDVPLAYSPQRVTDGQSVTFPFILGSILKWDYPLWAAMRLDPSMVLSVMGVPLPVQKQLTKEKHVELMNMLLPFASRVPGVMNDGKIANNMQPSPLQNITAPALVLSAKDDLWRTWPGAEYTAAHIAGARFTGFETGGHLHNGQEEQLRSEVVGFLIENSRPAPDAVVSRP